MIDVSFEKHQSRLQWLSLISCILTSGCALFPRTSPHEPLVDIHKVDPLIRVEIPYATANNFVHQILYPQNRCLLRASVAKRLALVQSDLALQGLGLKVWDCYRPLSIQRKLWSIVPNPDYVADPAKGSRHNRGAAVDVTLVNDSGRALEMPTDFDDFSPRAHRDSTEASAEATLNRSRLEKVMLRHGFSGLKTEWWHFDAVGWQRYPLLDVPLDSVSP